jgi:hypothetical protein
MAMTANPGRWGQPAPEWLSLQQAAANSPPHASANASSASAPKTWTICSAQFQPSNRSGAAEHEPPLL